MSALRIKTILLAAVIIGGGHAAWAQSLFITEIHAAGSGNGTYGADWFEVTNVSGSTVNITGWKMDDNSESPFGAVALRGVTAIAPGQSVIFLESAAPANDAALKAAFNTAWFGTPTSAVVIGNYGGGFDVALDASSDAVNLFSGTSRVANVFFNNASAGRTFDNSGLFDGNFTALTALSMVGLNGAFLSADGFEIGSPGVFAPIPEPSLYAFFAALSAAGIAARRRKFAGAS